MLAVELSAFEYVNKEKGMVTKYGGKYVVDDKGKAVSVLLDIKTFRKLLAEIEELESIRAYDIAKNSSDEVVPFEQAIQEIEKKQR